MDNLRVELCDSAKSFGVKNYKEYPDGSLLCWMRVAREGILEYGDSKDYLSKDQLYLTDSLDSIVGKAITLNHPSSHLKNLDDRNRVAVGTILQETVEDIEDGVHFLTVPGLITNERVKQHILKGDLRQVSPGHLTSRVKVYDSALGYDYLQQDRQYNHVALVGEGRAGNAKLLINDSKGSSMAGIIKLLCEFNDSLKNAGIEPDENWEEIDLKRAIVKALSGKDSNNLTIEACDSIIAFLPKPEIKQEPETPPSVLGKATAPAILDDSVDPIAKARQIFIKRTESKSSK